MDLNIKLQLATLKNFIWETPVEKIPSKLRPFITFLRIGHLIILDLLEGQLTLRSMGLVYTTLLAIVPLLAVSFSVLKGFGVHNQLEPIMLNLLAPLGEQGIEITQRIISFVDNIKAGVLGSMGLALLLYTVISLLQKIERAFNFTWRVSEHRPLAQRFSDYLSVILIGPVLVFTAIGMTASVSSVSLIKDVMEIEAIGSLITFAGHLIPYLLIIIAFTLIYILVPNTKVKFKSALVGGIIAGILWETSGWVFATFVVTSTKYTAIYSAFATLIIFMIWLYLNWLILLVGGSIAFYHQNPEQRNLQIRNLRLSNRMREKVSLFIMSLIGQNYYHNLPALTLNDLAKSLNVSFEIIGILTDNLVRSGLLVKTVNELPTYLPAQAPETLKLDKIIHVIRKSGETNYLKVENLPENEVIDSLYNNMEAAMYRSIEQYTLRDLSLPENYSAYKDTANNDKKTN